jgi:hypothetical protein
LFVALLIVLVSVAYYAFNSSSAEANLADPNIVVVLKGAGDLLEEPPIEGALCYETDLYNAHTDKKIGTGIDCLADIAPVGDGFLINRTTIFDFPQGKLYANGPTSVTPKTGGSPNITHIVGDIPADGANSIVGGTKRFAGATGRVRLSGAVNMGEFPGTIGFNCVFIIDLD